MQEDRWQVIHVRSNFEKRVSQHLVVRSVEHYLPLFSERVKWSDRTVVNERALFPGYVFVRSQKGSRLLIISTPGVVRLLGDNLQDTVSDSEIDRIREGLKSGLKIRPHPCVKKGVPVRVQSGVFAGVRGVVVDIRRECKVVIALPAVNQSFSLDVDINEIEVLSGSNATTSPYTLPSVSSLPKSGAF